MTWRDSELEKQTLGEAARAIEFSCAPPLKDSYNPNSRIWQERTTKDSVLNLYGTAMRRFTHLTIVFSKKWKNLKAALALYFVEAESLSMFGV